MEDKSQKRVTAIEQDSAVRSYHRFNCYAGSWKEIEKDSQDAKSKCRLIPNSIVLLPGHAGTRLSDADNPKLFGIIGGPSKEDLKTIRDMLIQDYGYIGD